MKKFIIPASMLLFLSYGAWACQSNSNSAATDTQPIMDVQQFSLTDSGVGPIVLGMKVADIPASVSGLYDRVQKEETPDAEEYQFFMGEIPVFTAGDYGDGIISIISLFNESPVKVATTSGQDYIEKD